MGNVYSPILKRWPPRVLLDLPHGLLLSYACQGSSKPYINHCASSCRAAWRRVTSLVLSSRFEACKHQHGQGQHQQPTFVAETDTITSMWQSAGASFHTTLALDNLYIPSPKVKARSQSALSQACGPPFHHPPGLMSILLSMTSPALVYC